jgi:hypothetical protein
MVRKISAPKEEQVQAEEVTFLGDWFYQRSLSVLKVCTTLLLARYDVNLPTFRQITIAEFIS